MLKTTRRLTGVVTIALLVSIILKSAAAADVALLRGNIAAALKEEGLVGASWATVGPDGAIATDAAGLMNASSQASLRADHKVQVGSIAKAVLATGILRLVSERRLQLDAPVAKLLPDVQIDNPWGANNPVTVRHLLDHTSGLDDARLWQVFSLEASPDTPLRVSLARGPGLLRLRSRPGSAMSYSNMGYTLLGMVVEAITGQRYEAYLNRHLLAPLRMQDSTFSFVTQDGAHGDPRLAMGHFEERVQHAAVPQFLRPAGQFTTTAHDMALFARFLLSDGKIDGGTFIAEGLLRSMGRPSGTDAALGGLQASYALGLNRRDRAGAVGLCHGGKTVGYSASLCIFPEDRGAFFIALNADSETANYERIDALLVRALEIPAQPPAPVVAFKGAVDEWRGVYVPSPGRFESFAYLDRVFNFVRLDGDQNLLRLTPFQGAAQELVPVGGPLFRAPGRVAASHVLLKTPEGERVLSDGYRSFQKIGGWRIALLWVSLAGGVSGLVYLLIAGLVSAVQHPRDLSRPLFFPCLAVLALMLPVPLFFAQSFLQLGDLTPASGMLALVTGLLPTALVYGFVQRIKIGVAGWSARLEVVALIGALQWTFVLAGWGLLPLTLWA